MRLLVWLFRAPPITFSITDEEVLADLSYGRRANTAPGAPPPRTVDACPIDAPLRLLGRHG